MAHSPPKINSFCLNTVCNIPKLVSYKMMMAVFLSFRLNRTVKKIGRTKHSVVPNVWSVATMQINSFCPNAVCNVPKLVTYKMMMAVVLSFRLNRTVKNRPNQTFCRTKVWSVATTQINSFCPNTVCNVPKLVHYKMMMAVVKCPH